VTTTNTTDKSENTHDKVTQAKPPGNTELAVATEERTKKGAPMENRTPTADTAYFI
jgi:hypothetical protein